jgi:GAF domain-containing protein/HAMP domain-containing protein
MTQPDLTVETFIPEGRTSLSGSLVRTLIIFTFIPFILMSGAAYLRARTLLRDQVVNQLQTQLTTQLRQADLAIKTKEIRLDRLIRSPDFKIGFQQALMTDRGAAEFAALRDNLANDVQAISPQNGKATFNQYFVMLPNGVIQIASKPSWEGLSLQSAPFIKTIKSGDQQSFVLYDFAPLYPGQLILLTVSQYKSSTGSPLGTVVGITEQQNLQDILQGLISVSPSANAYFASESGNFVGIDPYTNQLAVFKPSSSQSKGVPPILDLMMNQGVATPRPLEFSSSTGSPVLAEATWVSSMGTGVVLELPQAQIYGQLNSLIPFTVVVVLFALLAIAALISLSTTRIFRPLVSLSDITKRFSEGDFSQRASVTSTDEIGMLATSFNSMAEQLSEIYRSLEQKVEERSRQIGIASEIAQRITSTTNLDELLNRTVQLIVQQFNYYHASIFLLDQGGKSALLRAAYGPTANELLIRGHRVQVGSASIIGWVSANNQPRVTSDIREDPIHLKNELLPETRSEVGIPISMAKLVIGVLDVQSTQAGAFGPETIVMLQTLASQIAVAIQNLGLVESTQGNFNVLDRVYQASPPIASSQSRNVALEAAAAALKDSPFPTALVMINDSQLEIEAVNDSMEFESLRSALREIGANIESIQKYLSGSPVIAEANSTNLPPALTSFTRQMNFQSTSFLPISDNSKLAGLIIVGGVKQTLTSASVQPYAYIADLVGITLNRIAQTRQMERQLKEREALASVHQTIDQSSAGSNNYFAALHDLVRQNIGDSAFLVALFDKSTQTISVPYTYEEGRVDKIEAFPLGEGLASILIRTGRPLLVNNDAERRGVELGGKWAGKPAKSWMGAPMMVGNEPIGALVIQDLEKENVFDQENLTFLSALADQLASVLYNTRLLEESRTHTLQLETAAEIARDITGSLNLDELLVKAVNYIRERFDFYHAAIFLLDTQREYAVIREATGEAGAQMKRTGHKLGVGSKSIVGYVAGRGESLIINDTINDSTYLPNPLLPDTRAEAAIPLKVGERILGIIDVQSNHPYAFTEDNLRTLQILADQMAVAVVNSELFAETQEHLSQHRLLHHITTSAASGTTLEEALESAVTGLQVTLGGDRVIILLTDRDRKELEVKAAVGYSEDILTTRIPIGSGITGWAATHHRPLRVNDVKADVRYIQASPNTRSELAIPLIYRNDLLGVLNVESEHLNAYTENDEEMLGTLGGSLAAIIANARLLEQIRGQAERDRLLYEVTNKIRRSTNIRTILSTTATELTKAVGARSAQVRIDPRSDTNITPKNGSPNNPPQI